MAETDLRVNGLAGGIRHDNEGDREYRKKDKARRDIEQALAALIIRPPFHRRQLLHIKGLLSR